MNPVACAHTGDIEWRPVNEWGGLVFYKKRKESAFTKYGVGPQSAVACPVSMSVSLPTSHDSGHVVGRLPASDASTNCHIRPHHHRSQDAGRSLSWVAGLNANMGKNSRVKLKREGGQIMGRKSATKTNFGRVQVGGHSMNPGE